MHRIFGLAAVAVLLFASSQASAVTVTFDFETLTDQGWGAGFGNDASKAFPIVNIGGSNRMEVTLGGFQVAGRESQGADAFLAAMNQAAWNSNISTISYDWYVDTSMNPGTYGTFLQFGTYINSGSGAYTQDFPGAGKDVELNGAQLASGQVFSGTVTETLTQKYGAIVAGHKLQTFQRLGLILNGDGTPNGATAGMKVYFDNIRIVAIPEPVSLALLALTVPALLMWRRK